ncbi:hypothetical protein [Kitasatospora purpeofusca]|uniref:hypothetical protein n=1 Tax=Kitasatospora purpeofusca TaxID=67352 RepID=UPI002251E70D|nr:hypothetical protein [Kitasatospora purpeofusca]MCX4756618.1 helix-turn-helix domain-containing protein [Kitasatospora purpeofusca]WSR35585.1 helix-turn-helix domain-containing protein [Kitasatospora purpeofusca]WSR43903.1 helix-turn-helix domain-containing protein [Kitasatospora purpeofusca]
MPRKIPEPTGRTRTNLITAYATGTPGRALAKNHKVSEATMAKWLRRWGATKGPATSDPGVDREEAVRLYNDGTPLSTLMRHYGVTRRRMELLLEAWDVPVRRTPRHPQTDPKVDREEAVRLYNDGTSAQALAQLYGVTPDRVKRRLRAWDVPLRTRKQAAQHTARTRRETQARALDAYRLFP